MTSPNHLSELHVVAQEQTPRGIHFQTRWQEAEVREEARHLMTCLVAALPDEVKFFLQQSPWQMLAWGCVLGDGVDVLARAFPLSRITGMELGEAAVSLARQLHPSHEFLASPSGAIPRKFDVIIAVDGLASDSLSLRRMEEQAAQAAKLYLVLVPEAPAAVPDGAQPPPFAAGWPERLGEMQRIALASVETDQRFGKQRYRLAVYGLPFQTLSVSAEQQELQQLRAEIVALEDALNKSRLETEQQQHRLKLVEFDRDIARQELRTVYTSSYWRKLNRIWSVKRAYRGLAHGSLAGMKELIKDLLPLSTQQWLVRTFRRYSAPEEAISASEIEEYLTQRALRAHFDVVCFPVIDWGFRFQRPQQLMTQFAQAGHRVFYLSQAFRAVGPPYQLQQKGDNIFEVSLRGPAVNIYTDVLDEAGKNELLVSLDALRRDLGLGATLSCVQLPFWWPLAESLRQRCAWPVLYDCMDHHAGFTTNQTGMLALENELLKGADSVIVSSLYLAEQVKPFNDKIALVRNGCDYQHFAQVEYAPRVATRRPQIGYYGAIADWFDADLVADIAQKRPDWDFVMVGSTATADLTRLGQLPNVKLMGEQPYATLPDWLRQFDVTLIPFKRNPLTEATNPVKAYEILAAGKPLISVPLPEVVALNKQAKVVQLAATPDEFIREIERALAKNSVELAERRRAFARAHTWQARFAEMLPLARTSFPKASIVIVTYHNCELNRMCLKALYEQTEWPNFEVFVVDNASTDDTPQMLREIDGKYPNLSITLNAENVGFAKANNQALRRATGEYLVLLNNDTVVPRGWLSGLIRHLSARQDIGLIGPVTNEIGNEAKIPVGYQSLAEMPNWARVYVRERDNVLTEIPMLAMFCVAMRRQAYTDIGELDEQFGIGMFEDDDYTRRTRRLGYKVLLAEDVFIHHHGRAAFKLLSEEKYRAIFEENRRRYEAKYGEPWMPHKARG